MRRPCSAGPLLSLPRSVGQRDRRVATSVATSARGDTATGCVSGRVATASRPTRSERRREQVRQDGSFAKKQEGRTVILLVAARAREEPPATPASVRQRTRECPIQGSACEAGARRTRVSRLGDAHDDAGTAASRTIWRRSLSSGRGPRLTPSPRRRRTARAVAWLCAEGLGSVRLDRRGWLDARDSPFGVPRRCSLSLHPRNARVGRAASGRTVMQSRPGPGECADACDGGQPAG